MSRDEWWKKVGQRCENCRFVEYWEYAKQYTCRRHAPQPYSFWRYEVFELLVDIAWSARASANYQTPDNVPEKERSDVEKNMMVEATEINADLISWPRVEAGTWCGEWQPIPTTPTTK